MLSAGVFSGFWTSGLSQQAKEEVFPKEKMEQYLLTAKIVSVRKNMIGGKTGPWLIGLTEGKVARRGFFKHIHRPRPAPLPDSYQYEIAAYELDKLLDLNVVPPVVEREIEGRKGSLQIFLEDCFTERDRKRMNLEPPDPKSFQNSLDELRIFENLVYNKCRNTDDTRIHKESWKVCRVDFSEAFAPSPDLLPDCEISYCSERVFRNLQRLDAGTVQARLSPYLNGEEIKALLERKDKIIEKIRGLQKQSGHGQHDDLGKRMKGGADGDFSLAKD